MFKWVDKFEDYNRLILPHFSSSPPYLSFTATKLPLLGTLDSESASFSWHILCVALLQSASSDTTPCKQLSLVPKRHISGEFHLTTTGHFNFSTIQKPHLWYLQQGQDLPWAAYISSRGRSYCSLHLPFLFSLEFSLVLTKESLIFKFFVIVNNSFYLFINFWYH